jgi:DNA-binding NarL/FixJ family response regulator
MAKVRLVLVTDKPIIREGIANLLKSDPDFKIVAKCSLVEESIKAVKLYKANVVLVDTTLCDGAINELASGIQSIAPSTRIIALTDPQKISSFFPAILSGFTGFISKDCSFNNLIDAISLTSDGWLVIDPSLTKLAIQALVHQHMRMYQANPDRLNLLSKQELKILSLMVECDSNKELASALCSTENTVKVHIRNILRKLGARNRREAIICAIEHGFASCEKQLISKN